MRVVLDFPQAFVEALPLIGLPIALPELSEGKKTLSSKNSMGRKGERGKKKANKFHIGIQPFNNHPLKGECNNKLA